MHCRRAGCGGECWARFDLRSRVAERPLLGRLLVATNGCFADAKPERALPERRAALENPDRRLKVGASNSLSVRAVLGQPDRQSPKIARRSPMQVKFGGAVDSKRQSASTSGF